MKTREEKKLAGTLRNDRDDAGSLEGTFPEMEKKNRAPEFFNEEQKKHYRKVLNLLFETGLMKKVDQMAIEQLAITCHNFQHATQMVNDYGFVNKHDQVSPYYTIQQNSMKAISDFSRRYGLSVLDRNKLRGVETKDPDQLDMFEAHRLRKVE